MKPIRFLFLTCGYPPEKVAGAENAIKRMGGALVEQNHEVTVVTIHHDRSLPEVEIGADGVRILRKIKPVSFGPLWGITFRNQVRKILKEKSIEWDFVLCNSLFFYSDLAAIAAKETNRFSANRLMNAHEFSDLNVMKKERNGSKVIEAVRNNSHLFVLSIQSAREAIDGGFSKEQVHPFTNFLPDPGTQNNPSESSKTLLYMGRFSEQKNTELLLKSFLGYCDKGGKLSLKMVGDGDHKESLMVMLRESEWKNRVSIYPWSNDPTEHYRNCRAVISASLAEGMSNVIVEALAHSRPILWTDVSGVRDAIGMKENISSTIPKGEAVEMNGGWIVNVNDGEGFIDAFQKMEDDDLIKDQSSNARQNYLNKYTKEKSITAFLNEVKLIMDGGEETSPWVKGISL